MSLNFDPHLSFASTAIDVSNVLGEFYFPEVALELDIDFDESVTHASGPNSLLRVVVHGSTERLKSLMLSFSLRSEEFTFDRHGWLIPLNIVPPDLHRRLMPLLFSIIAKFAVDRKHSLGELSVSAPPVSSFTLSSIDGDGSDHGALISFWLYPTENTNSDGRNSRWAIDTFEKVSGLQIRI
jgi:hypothetical protein